MQNLTLTPIGEIFLSSKSTIFVLGPCHETAFKMLKMVLFGAVLLKK
jgi:hypothetical protein